MQCITITELGSVSAPKGLVAEGHYRSGTCRKLASCTVLVLLCFTTAPAGLVCVQLTTAHADSKEDAPEGLVAKEGHDSGGACCQQSRCKGAGAPMVDHCAHTREKPVVRHSVHQQHALWRLFTLHA